MGYPNVYNHSICKCDEITNDIIYRISLHIWDKRFQLRFLLDILHLIYQLLEYQLEPIYGLYCLTTYVISIDLQKFTFERKINLNCNLYLSFLYTTHITTECASKPRLHLTYLFYRPVVDIIDFIPQIQFSKAYH